MALGTLPSGVAAGTPASVRVRIADDEDLPRVTLSVAPNPVAEGSETRVTATLSEATPSGRHLSVPLMYRPGTSERPDFERTTRLIIVPGSRSGYTMIRTYRDADADDETFTVAVDEAKLASWVRAGSPASVEVTITDDGRDDPPPEDPPPDPPPADPPGGGGGGGGSGPGGDDPDDEGGRRPGRRRFGRRRSGQPRAGDGG